jgi:hypothetical protein
MISVRLLGRGMETLTDLLVSDALGWIKRVVKALE